MRILPPLILLPDVYAIEKLQVIFFEKNVYITLFEQLYDLYYFFVRNSDSD
jgi:hypothetical protein